MVVVAVHGGAYTGFNGTNREEFMSTEKDVPQLSLQREVILPSSDRGRLAAIVATCSLAGLAGGMALSMLAETNRAASTRASAAAHDTGPISWLGVRIVDANRNECSGTIVRSVTPDSPADDIGLQVKDVILTFGGDRICSQDSLIDAVRASAIGATPEIHIRRGTEELVLHPTLAEMPPAIRARLP
jgi:S1-C subfamily serine protease